MNKPIHGGLSGSDFTSHRNPRMFLGANTYYIQPSRFPKCRILGWTGLKGKNKGGAGGFHIAAPPCICVPFLLYSDIPTRAHYELRGNRCAIPFHTKNIEIAATGVAICAWPLSYARPPLIRAAGRTPIRNSPHTKKCAVCPPRRGEGGTSVADILGLAF